MADLPASPDGQTQLEISLLEQNRQDNSRAMWLAPVLTMTAQAFLLQTLSSEDLRAGPRAVVLLAGLMATFAALWSLLRARSREVLFSEAIAARLREAGILDLRPSELIKHHQPTEGDESGYFQKLDARLARWSSQESRPRAYMVWGLTLVAFMAADVAVFLGSGNDVQLCRHLWSQV